MKGRELTCGGGKTIVVMVVVPVKQRMDDDGSYRIIR